MKRLKSIFKVIILTCLIPVFGAATFSLAESQLNLNRDRANAMLNIVAKDLARNYYDPKMEGLNWPALVRRAHQQIQQASTNGQMMSSIYALVDKLHDSHTFFIPPMHSADIHYGFDAKPFGERILVCKVKKNGPALQAGLKLGDQIVAVNNFRAARKTFDQMMLFFRVLAPVPEMDLAVVRGNEPPRTISLKPKIQMDNVMVDLTDTATAQHFFLQEVDGQEEPAEHRILQGNIGYVRWRWFDDEASPLERNLQAVHKAKAVILDLRGNPGGALDTLESVAGYLVSGKVTIAETRLRKKDDPLKVGPRRPDFTQPLFILVDSESASAAEIFARYFQITHRATIIGDQTSGRVATAQIFPEKYGMNTIVPFGLEIDVGHVFFKNGEDLERRGVTPDKLCLPTPDDLSNRRDPCLKLAEQLAEGAVSSGHKP